MPYQLKVQLKQQAPLIHFQSGQAGATLRASEVKPKLDKFLYKKLYAQTIISQDEWNKWLIKRTGGEMTSGVYAFQYQMRITSDGEPYVYSSAQMPKIYYGNMGDDTSLYSYCLKADCTMVILCFIPELLKLISESLEEFFIVTNFGRMSGKGFGSYIVAPVDSREAALPEPELIIDSLCKASGSRNCYVLSGYGADDVWCSTFQDRQGNVKYKNVIFDDIQKLYQVMKSGYNIGDSFHYHRSFLFEYFHEKGNIGNEKAYIKQNKLTPQENDKPVHHPDKTITSSEEQSNAYQYVRALLGLSDHMEYITGFYRMNNGKWKAKKDKMVIEIQHNYVNDGLKKRDRIERIPSPVFFKIIDYTVYVVANRIDEDVFKKTFTFTGNGKSEDLKTPDSFDIDDFLEWFFDGYVNACEALGSYGRTPNYQIKASIKKHERGAKNV